MQNSSFSLNVRLLAVFVLCVLFLGGAVFILHHFQLQRQSDFFLQKARAGVEEFNNTEDPLQRADKIKETVRLYKRYLIQNEDDLEIAKEFALMYYDAAKSLLVDAAEEQDRAERRKIRNYGMLFYGAAISRLEDVLRKDTQQPKLRTKLVDIFFESGKWSDAVDHIKLLCSPPENSADLAKLLDKYDLWKRVAPLVSSDQTPEELLKIFLSGEEDTVNRQKVIDFLGDDLWMIIEDAGLLSTYASCQAVREKFASAEKSLQKAIVLAPEDSELYEKLAYLLCVVKPPRVADADYWINEMVQANPESFDASLRRCRYANKVVMQREADQQLKLAQNAVLDALGALHKAIVIVADEADRQAPSLDATKALKQALLKLPEHLPASKDKLSSVYQQALLEATAAAVALKDKLERIDEEVGACRDALFLAAQSEWLVNRLKTGDFPDAAATDSDDGLKDALLYAETLKSLYPDYAPGYSMLSEIELQAGNKEQSVSALRHGGELCDNNTGLLWRLASVLIDGGQIEDAKQVCRQLEDNPKSEDYIVEHLKARIAFSEGHWLDAANGFEAVRDEVAARWPSHVKRLDYLLAECYGHLGRLDQQRDAYYRAAASDRTWLPALMGIAKTKSQTGQIDDAIEDYRLIIKLHNASESAAFALIKLLIHQGLRDADAEKNFQEAAAIIKSLEEKNASLLQTALLKAELYFAQGLDTKATDILSEMKNKLEVEERFLKAKLENVKNSGSGQTKKEQEDLQARLAKIESDVRANTASQAVAWTAIIKVAQRKRDWNLANEAIRAVLEIIGDTVSIRLTQGQYLVNRIGEKAADPLRSLAGNTEHFSKEARLRLWQGLAMLSLRVGDYVQAELLSRSVLREEPGNWNMQIIRFQIAVQQKDLQVIEEILAEIQKDEKTPGPFWHYGQAVRLQLMADEEDDPKFLNQAQTHIYEALHRRPNWPAARLLAANLHDKQGNKEAALENFRKAIDLGVQSSKVIRRTVQLLAGFNKYREADQLLRTLGNRNDVLEGEIDFESSIVKAQIGKYEDALELARQAAEGSIKPNDHVWLGQLLSIVGRRAENQKRSEEAQKTYAEAEAAFEKAISLDKANDLAWIALIQFYGQTKQIQKAESAIKKAQDALPSEKAAMVIAQCYEAIGKRQEAETLLLDNLAANPKDVTAVDTLADFYIRNNQVTKAVEELKKITDGEVQADNDQKAKARRIYATILFQQGNEENRKKALKMIESNLRLNATSEADQYAKAVLLANDLSTKQREKAIPTLEKLIDAQRSPSPEVQFTLAKLYLTEGQLMNFQEIMRNIIKSSGKEPRYLAFYVDAMLDHDELKQAGIYLELLKKSQANPLMIAKLEAKYAFKLKNYETAINILKRFLELPQSDQRTRLYNTTAVANLLGGFASILKQKGGHYRIIANGFDDEAASVFQQAVDMQPGQEMLMAIFLAKQGRLQDALKTAKKYADSASPQDIAQACFVFLQSGSPGAEQLRQIDALINDAREKHEEGEGAFVLKIALAILRDFQGRDREAEVLYREILEQKPDDPTAMNNLAMFLALQNRNLEEAAELINKAIRDNGPLPGLLDTRAIVHLAMNQPRKALDDLSQALNQQPTAVRYFHQAQAYFQDGQKKAAIKALDMADKLGLKENMLFGIERMNYRKLVRVLQ